MGPFAFRSQASARNSPRLNRSQQDLTGQSTVSDDASQPGWNFPREPNDEEDSANDDNGGGNHGNDGSSSFYG